MKHLVEILLTLCGNKPLVYARSVYYERKIPTKQCLKARFSNASRDDILIIGSLLINSNVFLGYDKIAAKYFGNILNSQHTLQVSDVTAIIDALLQSFPGAIIWLPFPYTRSIIPYKMIEDSNSFTLKAIEAICSERLLFINTYPILKSQNHLYIDDIHHPGVLSDIVVKIIFSSLNIDN